jgi:glycine/D-amino acid oxidase-like deaminating enzyme
VPIGRVPYLRGAYGKRGIAEVGLWGQEWNDYGAPVTFNLKQITEQTTGGSFFDASMEDARGGSLQPLSYVRGLARAALAAGVKIYTHSPADRIQITGNDWQLTTQNGKVTAHHLLVCTNGYSGNLWPGLKQNVVPVASLQAATEPLVDDLRSRILPKGHHVSETRQHADTAHLKAEAIRMYPELASVKWDFECGGLVAITKTHMPLLLKLDTNAHAGFGYNGRGVAMATSMGQQLAHLILGEDAPMLQTKSAPFVFHAFRNIGIAWHMLTGNFLDRFDG